MLRLRPLSSLPAPRRLTIAAIAGAFVLGGVVGGVGCGGSVDCEALCQRTLACNVAFAPADDPDERKVEAGERSELESCSLGCEESPTVDVDSAGCVDGVEIGATPDTCQDQVLTCLGLEEAIVPSEGEGEGEAEG